MNENIKVLQSDYDLVDRLAAAWMRNDSRRDMAEMTAAHRREGQVEGMQKYRRELVDEQQAVERWEMRANAVFETKDGLKIPQSIDLAGTQYTPQVWKRACVKMPHSFTNETPTYQAVEVRSYELTHRDSRGRPVYVEKD